MTRIPSIGLKSSEEIIALLQSLTQEGALHNIIYTFSTGETNVFTGLGAQCHATQFKNGLTRASVELPEPCDRVGQWRKVQV